MRGNTVGTPYRYIFLFTEYREPYLVIIQFNSVEIVLIDPRADSAAASVADRAYLSLPRYVLLFNYLRMLT